MKTILLRHVVLLIVLLAGRAESWAQSMPQPGELYREFARHNDGNLDWRVTDDEAVKKFDRARAHLPNPVLELTVDDLAHAVRAEVLLDRWAGHVGTVNKRIRFNDREWIPILQIEYVPDGVRAKMLMGQDNPVVEVPLEHLVEGTNVFEADCDEDGGFGWGQWGLYSLVLRVYYDPPAKGDDFQIEGKILSPLRGQSIGDHPVIRLAADAPHGVARVDVLARYNGYDEDGDGLFDSWHKSRFQLVRGEPNSLRDHVGTLWKEPYRMTWDTSWVPDQDKGGISLMAHIQDSRGYWRVTDIVDDLTLARDGVSVRLYRAHDVPEGFGVRAASTMSCRFEIPPGEDLSLATDAVLHLRTWHGWDGHHLPLRVNDHEMPIRGKNHFYDYDMLDLPTSSLRSGRNTFTVHSETEHHHLEVLWPGPAISVRSRVPPVAISRDTYEQRPHFVVTTKAATYWLDQQSGGLSRLIDPDGNDWIGFRREPWGSYPASAASAFRGLPNLVPLGDDEGFGHPGWDRAASTQLDADTIVCESLSGKWQLRWDFSPQHAQLTVERSDAEQPYWFLYEGAIAGRWSPAEQYFATNVTPPADQPHDFFAGDRRYETWDWAYFGDHTVPRVLYAVHQQRDQLVDTFSHLGNADSGLQAPDGMVVFGFGRGRKGKEPLLSGSHSFRIGFLDQMGSTDDEYDAIRSQLNRTIPQE